MKHAPRLAGLIAVALAPQALAGWQSLQDLPAPRVSAGALLFEDGRVALSVAAVAEGVVRVRFAPRPSLGRDHSYARVEAAPVPPAARVLTEAGVSTLALASGLRVRVRHAPGRIEFQDADGLSLDADDDERGMAWAGQELRVFKRLRDDEHVYGLGEKAGPLDKRGWQLGGSAFAMWNTDTYLYDASTDPLYASVPFFMVLRQGRAHGVLLDNTHRTSFDVGRSARGRLSFGAEGGELDYYFIDGPTPKDVVRRYAALTGRVPLPPRWALGYQQCRYSYFPEARLRQLAAEFRRRAVPADALWLDIHHLKDFEPLTWDPERFPDPGRLIADLRAQGLRTVVIVDPHIEQRPGEAHYESGLRGGHFVTRADGSLATGNVWPARAEREPGPSVFPDYSRPATRAWWGGLLGPLLELGVAGIWNDMNEPALFDTPTGTLPLDARHDGDGQPADHAEIHNVYGQLMSRATFEGLERLRPQARPFVLTRATFAGGQRYAALWPGDNSSDWSQLSGSIPMLLGLGLSGFSFVGADIGGYSGEASPELLTRWLQLGAFYPFMRAHSEFGTPDKEPWAHGPAAEARNRRAIELRYELLPHVYNVMGESSREGLPAMRPLFLEYPRDQRTYALQDQFLFGSELLVAPVVREGARRRQVYLPAGDWYDFWTGALQAGAANLTVDAPLERVPLYVRGGAFVFRQPVVQHTGQMPGQPLIVEVYPAARSQATLYEDDGETLDYQRGVFLERRFEQRRAGTRVSVSVAAPTGSYRPAARELRLRVLFDGSPQAVRLDGRALRWTMDGRFVEARFPDAFAAAQLEIE